MRVTTSITWNMTTGEVLDHRWVEYSGTIALAKGEGTSKKQMEFENKLTQQAFNAQMQRLNAVQNALQGRYLTGNEGFDPQQLALLRSQTLNNTTSQFNDAGQNVRAALAARGANSGSLPPSG